MDQALRLAERGRGATSPNPMVGAVVVSDRERVVGSGYHARAGESHAEVVALDEAGTRARDGTLYCTLEPCSHQGRTGPCAGRVVEAGIRRVVLGTVDPNPLVSGNGIAFLREHGIDVEVDPNMIDHPRESSYERMDGWDEEAIKWFEQKRAESMVIGD